MTAVAARWIAISLPRWYQTRSARVKSLVPVVVAALLLPIAATMIVVGEKHSPDRLQALGEAQFQRGKRDDAPFALLFGQLQQGIHGSADLERAGPLQVFALQADLDPDSFRKRVVGEEGGAVDRRCDPGGGSPDVIQTDRRSDI